RFRLQSDICPRRRGDRHGPCVGRPSVRHRRCRSGRRFLRHLPRPDARGRSGYRLRIRGSGAVDSDDLGGSVRRHARRLVRPGDQRPRAGVSKPRTVLAGSPPVHARAGAGDRAHQQPIATMRFWVSGREASGTMPLVRTFSLARLALAATFLATPGVLLAGVWDSTYAQAPLSLEPNQGQTDPVVDFIARGRGYSVFRTAKWLVLSLQTKSTPAPPTVLRVELAGARASHAEGLDEQAGKSHYFLGNDPAKWRTNIPHFARVKYPGVYPGIDLVWYGNHGRLEYDFQLAAGADPRLIAFVFEGSDKIRIEPGGDLVVRVADHEFHHLRPVVYQQTEVGRRFISGRYVRRAERAVGFEVSGYDPRKPIVIDPVLAFSTFLGGDLLYSTYLGGAASDSGNGIASDPAGNVYVVGGTRSDDYPITAGAFQQFPGGQLDAYVTKIDPTQSGAASLVYSTYLGGLGIDRGTGVAVDSDGNA